MLEEILLERKLKKMEAQERKHIENTLPWVPPPQGLLPRPASKFPRIDRAVNEVEKDFPTLREVDVHTWDFLDPRTPMSAIGQVRAGQKEAPIELSPMLMAAPQEQVQSTLVHELEHVLQNRAGRNDPSEFARPYLERPSEIEAFNKSEDYRNSKKIPHSFSFDPLVFEHIIKGIHKK